MNLNGFFRAKVLHNKDTQLSGIIGAQITTLIGEGITVDTEYDFKNENASSNLIFLRPVNYFSESTLSTHSIFNGTYKAPKVNDFVMCFFLKGDINQGFYFPSFTIPFPDQKISGYNLSTDDASDFFNVERKPYISITELENRNIYGYNNNQNSQHFFLKFDNGPYVSLKSPNKDTFKTGDTSYFKIFNGQNDSSTNNHIESISGKNSTSLEFKTNKQDNINNIAWSPDKSYQKTTLLDTSSILKQYSDLDGSGYMNSMNCFIDTDRHTTMNHSKTLSVTSYNENKNISINKYPGVELLIGDSENVSGEKYSYKQNIDTIFDPGKYTSNVDKGVAVSKFNTNDYHNTTVLLNTTKTVKSNSYRLHDDSGVEDYISFSSSLENSKTGKITSITKQSITKNNHNRSTRLDTIISNNIDLSVVVLDKIDTSLDCTTGSKPVFLNTHTQVNTNTSITEIKKSVDGSILYDNMFTYDEYLPMDYAKVAASKSIGLHQNTVVDDNGFIMLFESTKSGQLNFAKNIQRIQFTESNNEGIFNVSLDSSNSVNQTTFNMETANKGKVDILVKNGIMNIDTNHTVENFTKSKTITGKEYTETISKKTLKNDNITGEITNKGIFKANKIELDITNFKINGTKLTIDISSMELTGAILKLLNDTNSGPILRAAFLTIFNSHTHLSASPGSPTTPPVVPAVSPTLYNTKVLI